MHLVLCIAVTLAGLIPAGVTNLSQEPSKVIVAHSHEHDSEHHTHQTPLSADLSNKRSNESKSSKTDQSGNSNQHTHEILTSCNHSIFIEQKHNTIIGFELNKSHPDPEDILPPNNFSLGSIFRPPIV